MYLFPDELGTALDALRQRESWCSFQGYFDLAQRDRVLIEHIQMNTTNLGTTLSDNQTRHLQSALARQGDAESIVLLKALSLRST